MDLFTFFTWIVKAIMAMGGLLLVICIWIGFKFVYNIIDVALFQIRLAHKWNKFRKLSPEAKAEALKDKRFLYPNENSTDPKEYDQG